MCVCVDIYIIERSVAHRTFEFMVVLFIPRKAIYASLAMAYKAGSDFKSKLTGYSELIIYSWVGPVTSLPT